MSCARPTIVFIGGKDPFRNSGGLESFGLAHAEAASLAGFGAHWFYLSRDPATTGDRTFTAHPLRTIVRPIRTWTAAWQAPFAAAAIVRAVEHIPGPIVLHAFATYASIAVFVKKRLASRGRATTAIASVFTTIDHEYVAKTRGLTRAHGLANVQARLEYLAVRAFATPAERSAFAQMDLLLVNYQSVRELLAREYVLQERVRRIPYAPLTAFQEMPTGFGDRKAGRDTVPFIVSVSRHDPRKGLDRFLQALALLRDEGVAFRARLVGTGTLLNAHRSLATSLRLDDRVEIVGRVADVRASLDRADIFVLPSLEEGSGSVSLLEAMQARCAIVATRIDGIPEDVVDGESALLVAPDDPRGLCDAMARLIRNPMLRERLAAEAHATYERRFTADVLTDALRTLYTELGSRHGLM